MSVRALSHNDAIRIANGTQQTVLEVRKNFFDVFGTTGCLLNCQDEGIRQQVLQASVADNDTHSKAEKRKKIKFARKVNAKQPEVRQGWFTAGQIATSISMGCGSCSVLSEILRSTLSDNQLGLSDRHQYCWRSSNRNLELKRRPLGQQGPVAIVQLYQPPGSHVRFWQLAQSNCLLGGDVSFARLHMWIKECLNSHNNCIRQSTVHDEKSRPARLIDLKPIRLMKDSGIRLINTSPGSSYEYACLSHRFDNALKRHETTTDNLLDHLKFIRLKGLPTNFRDAVAIARNLGIRYLWIDSICIIQEGDHGDDLSRELAKMGFIYQKAKLTIAAMSSPDAFGGCFIKDKWPDKCFTASSGTGEDHLIGVRTLDQKGSPASHSEISDHYPLLYRGWIFQERLLSTRLLLCNYGEFAFECLESSHCECGSSLAPHVLPTSEQASNSLLTQSRRLLVQNDEAMRSLDQRSDSLKYWKTIVENYMQHNLSYSSDVLPAIAGCAQTLTQRFQLTYIAGMWKETLETDLLWYVAPARRRMVSSPRPGDSTAPSWSWASAAMGQKIVHFLNYRGLLGSASNNFLKDIIKEVYCKPQSAINPFGKLEHAYLKIHSILYPWYLRSFCWDARLEINGRGPRVKDLYVDRATPSTNCSTEPKELVLLGADLELYFDGYLEEGEKGSKPTPFRHCVQRSLQPQHVCRLVQIYLLHVVHEARCSGSTDVLLLLERAASVDEKTNCYRRIGLMKLASRDINVCSWRKIYNGRIEPLNEEFWLL